MDLFSVLCSLILTFALVAYFASGRRPPNFPPGPWGWGLPFVGHLPFLGIESHKTAATWKPKYGPVLGIRFGYFPCVIISDHKLLKEAFADPAFAGRPKFQFALDRSGATSGGHVEGVIFTVGHEWREQRTFVQRALRERGKESIILEQMEELVDILQKEIRTGNGVIDTHARFNVAIVNVLWSVLTGAPFAAQSDPELQRITRLTVDALAETNVFALLSMFLPPWFTSYFPRWITRADGLKKLYEPMLQIFQPFIDEHWSSITPDHSRDFMDEYIHQIKNTADPTSSFHAGRANHSLATVLLDLFIAGSETIGTTLVWVCLLLASYPEVQEKLAEEIETVLNLRRPSLDHRRLMPYAEAVLHEVMRFRSILPLAVFRSTTEPVRFHGYDIPKDTMVLGNIWEAHNNQELWGDPENFRPERWLNESRTEFVRHEGFLAFSTGRRVCLGEQLARDELFLFTVAIFQAFRVGLDPGTAKPSLEPQLGGSSLGAKPHRLLFQERDVMQLGL